MKASEIKLRKEVVLDAQYPGSKSIHWWFDAGTKHLPAVYTVKNGYSYAVLDAEGKRYSHYCDHLDKIADVKEFIANYDAEIDRAEAAKKAEEEAYIAARKAADKKTAELFEGFLSVPRDVKFEVGGFIDLKLSESSKNETVADNLYAVVVEGRVSAVRAKVVKEIKLTTAEYDDFAVRLMDGQDWWVRSDDDRIVGGSDTDDETLKDLSAPEIINNPVLLDRYREVSYSLVHAISAPGRETFFVNTEGYNYARYVAFAA